MNDAERAAMKERNHKSYDNYMYGKGARDFVELKDGKKIATIKFVKGKIVAEFNGKTKVLASF